MWPWSLVIQVDSISVVGSYGVGSNEHKYHPIFLHSVGHLWCAQHVLISFSQHGLLSIVFCLLGLFFYHQRIFMSCLIFLSLSVCYHKEFIFVLVHYHHFYAIGRCTKKRAPLNYCLSGPNSFAIASDVLTIVHPDLEAQLVGQNTCTTQVRQACTRLVPVSWFLGLCIHMTRNWPMLTSSIYTNQSKPTT
jgi:hypothetical protein